MKKIIYFLTLALSMGFLTACNDDDAPQFRNPSPAEQWGKTLRGDDQSLKAYPDIFANYWEYTFSYKDNPNIGLRLTGKFPKARFFNFTVYNDDTQIDVSSIEDVNIKEDDGSINPYVKVTEDYKANGYTIYIIPASTPATVRASMKNICEFPDNVEMLSVFMRNYLAQQYGGDEFGGTEMPAIQAFDVTTGEEVEFPARQKCKIHDGLNMPPLDFSKDDKPLPFMRAPLNLMYPNTPAEYLFTRIKLNAGEVATFRFIPPTAPKSVSEYPTADVRYWSICLGSKDTYSYQSIYDADMPDVDSEGYVTIVIADKNSTKLGDIQKKAKANKGTYVMTWDRAAQGDGILALYRNMVINDSYAHSMRKQMESIPLSAAGGDMTDFKPMKMIAMLAMGNWGPQGYKFAEDAYLDVNFNYTLIRRMQ